MLRILKHTFNPFMENTYVVADETKECVIIDPGCSNEMEQKELTDAIESLELKPVQLLNTHCHIDHIPGNKFIFNKYGLLPEFHESELPTMRMAIKYGEFLGFQCEPSPEPKKFLKAGDEIKFGNSSFKILFTPGHSPGSLSFYNEAEKITISGDVLFYMSVGRFDLPGANGAVLFETLTQTMMSLPDDVKVYSGHGPETTIGFERKNNPFLQDKALFR